MTRRKNQHKPNGHAGQHGRINGHAPASTEPGGIPVPRDRAASDDASGGTDARAASSATAPGTVRKAYAEVAPPPPNGEAIGSAQEDSHKRNKLKKIPPGESPLPQNPGDFVEEIHRRIDVFEVWQRLLKSKDEKIKQRAVERLTDLRYKGSAGLTEEPQQFIFDMPRPNRD